jgi:predicted RNase H-like HicB family nuclease
LHLGDLDEGGHWATCLELPGANGQGETKEECLASLSDAVRMLLVTERESALKSDPAAEQISIGKETLSSCERTMVTYL